MGQARQARGATALPGCYAGEGAGKCSLHLHAQGPLGACRRTCTGAPAMLLSPCIAAKSRLLPAGQGQGGEIGHASVTCHPCRQLNMRSPGADEQAVRAHSCQENSQLTRPGRLAHRLARPGACSCMAGAGLRRRCCGRRWLGQRRQRQAEARQRGRRALAQRRPGRQAAGGQRQQRWAAQAMLVLHVTVQPQLLAEGRDLAPPAAVLLQPRAAVAAAGRHG